tara:strand:+ start:870 stop:1865 length:996 start_codon:yes stop_codon:yes gene_type:complete
MPITTKKQKPGRKDPVKSGLQQAGKAVLYGGGAAVATGAAVTAGPALVKGAFKGAVGGTKLLYQAGATGFGVTKIPSAVKSAGSGAVKLGKGAVQAGKDISKLPGKIKGATNNLIDIKVDTKNLDLGTVSGKNKTIYGQPDFKVPADKSAPRVYTEPATRKIVTETVEDSTHMIKGKPKRTVQPKMIDGQKLFEGGGSKYTSNKPLDLYKPKPESKVGKKQRSLIKKAERQIASIQASDMADPIKKQKSNKVVLDTQKEYQKINKKDALKVGTRKARKDAEKLAKKRAAQKVIAKTIAKGAGRLIPGVGAVIVAKDIYDVGKFALSKRKKK